MVKKVKKIGTMPIPTGVELLDDEKLATYIEIYNLIKSGKRLAEEYANISESKIASEIVEEVDYAYSWLYKLYADRSKTCPELTDKVFNRCVFNAFPSLTAVKEEFLTGWFIGEPIDVEHGILDLWGGNDDFRKDMSWFRNEIFVRGQVRSCDLPKNSVVKDACSNAKKVEKDIIATKRMLKEEIPEYSLQYDDKSGRLTINNKYELACVNAGSVAGKMAKEITSHASETGEPAFTPDCGSTSQNLRTVINQALGLNGVLFDIFLKGTRKNQYHSRSPVLRKTLLDEEIDLFRIDLELLKAGVETVPKVIPEEPKKQKEPKN